MALIIRFIILAGLFAGWFSNAAPAQTSTVIPDTQAEQHLGQDVTVEGVVTAVTTSRKGNTFINFSRVYPNQTFTVGFLLAHRWLLTLRYRHCRGRRSRSPEELSFIGGSLRIMSKDQLVSE